MAIVIVYFFLNSITSSNTIQNVFDIVIYGVKEFPEIICINERVDEIDYCLMSSIMEETVDFYKDFGYKVIFEKLNEVN